MSALGWRELLGAIPALLGVRVAEAQARVYRIGYLQTAARDFQGHLIHAFEDGLRDLGWRIGQNGLSAARALC